MPRKIGDMRITICTPSGGSPTVRFLVSVVNLILALGTLDDPPAISMLCVDGSITHRSREFLANLALVNEATDLLWLDDDMVFAPEAVLSLISRDVPIVAANYPRRSMPIVFTAHHLNFVTVMVTDDKSVGLEKAGGVGFGMLLMKSEVIEAIKPPRFAPAWDDGLQDYLGEDVVFCRKALAAGFDVWVDHDASKLIKHTGNHHYSWRQASG